MADAISIAKWFVNNTDRSVGEAVTHLKVQKLLYYAQAWHLLAYKTPLFEEDMQAWSHGPVAPTVYKEFKDSSWNAIPPFEGEGDLSDLGEDSTSILRQVLNIYGDFSAKRLEHMTHAEAPWKITRGDLPPEAKCTRIIPKELMLRYFTETYGELADVEETPEA